MNEEHAERTREAADRVLEFAEEVEASGEARMVGSGLESARASLHKWIDEMTGVVVTPALGRVTVLHANGRESTISSPDLPFAMTAPLGSDTPGAR